MTKLRAASAVLLALILIVFGANKFLDFIPMQDDDGSAGYALLMKMHEGGLMLPISISHIVIGLLLLLPSLRFTGALLQLPMSLGIVAFHATMMPAGLVLAIPLLVLNLVAVADLSRLTALVAAR